MIRRCFIAAVVGCLSLALVWLTAGQTLATSSVPSGVTVKALAQGPVKALPAGKVFEAILEFRQLPGSDFGPHAHVPGILYTLHGTATISYPGAAPLSVGPGEAAFIPALAVHTHQNLDGRIGAGAIAIGLVVLVILLCAATWLRGGRRRVAIAALSVLLIAGGTLPVIGATSNDYYLLAVRSPSEHDRPMPRPDGRVAFLSPDLNPIPAAPYVETLSAITVPPGMRYDAPNVAGPQTVIAVAGSGDANIGNQTQKLGGGGADMAQTGQTLAIVNTGSDALQVLDFAVTSLAAMPATL